MNRLKGKRTYIVRKRTAPRPTKKFVRRQSAPISLKQHRKFLKDLKEFPDHMLARSATQRRIQGKAGTPYVSGWARRLKVPKGVNRTPKWSYNVHHKNFDGPKLLAKLQAVVRGRQQRDVYNKVQKTRLKKSFNRRFNPGYSRY